MKSEQSFKAKITTSNGAVYEFEGTQDFVETQINHLVAADIQNRGAAKPEGQTKKKRSNGSPQSRRVSESPKMMPALVVGVEKINGLRKFYSQKNPVGQMEVYAVLAYWLRKNVQVDEVSIDEMWTLHKILGKKPPKVLLQPFRDAKSRKGYFDLGSESGKYVLTPFGETTVEHDLPAKESPDGQAA